jgi:hypothetical protein
MGNTTQSPLKKMRYNQLHYVSKVPIFLILIRRRFCLHFHVGVPEDPELRCGEDMKSGSPARPPAHMRADAGTTHLCKMHNRDVENG